MLESFKINCLPLGRSLRVTVFLPKDYNNTSRYYSTIYFLDGQNVFHKETSDNGQSYLLEETLMDLSKEDKDVLVIAIDGAVDLKKRQEEYQQTILADFIDEKLHPFLKQRYRMNAYCYCVGCANAALNALYLSFKESFKGCILFAPEGNFESIVFPTEPKLYYFYTGENEANGICLQNIRLLQEKNKNVHILIDQNEIHTETAWKSKLMDAFSYLIL